MKRVLCITLAILLLIPALLLPAAAAERKEYVFDYFEVPFAYLDFPFLPNEDYISFLYEGELPEGVYKIIGIMNSHYADPAIRVVAPDMLFVEYECVDDSSNVYRYQTFFTCYICRFDEVLGSLSSDLVVTTFEIDGENYTLLSFDGSLPMLDQIVFVDYFLDSVPAVDFEASISSVSGLFSQFTTDTLLKVLGVGIGASAGLALCWFGYRFFKKKLTNAFRRGSV